MPLPGWRHHDPRQMRVAGGLNAAIFKSSDTVEIVEQLDVLADEIEFRGEA